MCLGSSFLFFDFVFHLGALSSRLFFACEIAANRSTSWDPAIQKAFPIYQFHSIFVSISIGELWGAPKTKTFWSELLHVASLDFFDDVLLRHWHNRAPLANYHFGNVTFNLFGPRSEILTQHLFACFLQKIAELLSQQELSLPSKSSSLSAPG